MQLPKKINLEKPPINSLQPNKLKTVEEKAPATGTGLSLYI
jgi:hypothetical protein